MEGAVYLPISLIRSNRSYLPCFKAPFSQTSVTLDYSQVSFEIHIHRVIAQKRWTVDREGHRG